MAARNRISLSASSLPLTVWLLPIERRAHRRAPAREENLAAVFLVMRSRCIHCMQNRIDKLIHLHLGHPQVGAHLSRRWVHDVNVNPNRDR